VDLQIVAAGKRDSPFKGFSAASVLETGYVIEFERVTMREKKNAPGR
jgi:hypothetical protein